MKNERYTIEQENSLKLFWGSYLLKGLAKEIYSYIPPKDKEYSTPKDILDIFTALGYEATELIDKAKSNILYQKGAELLSETFSLGTKLSPIEVGFLATFTIQNILTGPNRPNIDTDLDLLDSNIKANLKTAQQSIFISQFRLSTPDRLETVNLIARSMVNGPIEMPDSMSSPIVQSLGNTLHNEQRLADKITRSVNYLQSTLSKMS